MRRIIILAIDDDFKEDDTCPQRVFHDKRAMDQADYVAIGKSFDDMKLVKNRTGEQGEYFSAIDLISKIDGTPEPKIDLTLPF